MSDPDTSLPPQDDRALAPPSGGRVDAAKATVERTQAELKAEIERAKQTVEEVRTELSTATDDRRGGPATDVEDAERKAAALRQGIQRDIAALRARIPETSETVETAKRLGIIAGGTIIGVTTLTVVLSKRARTRSERKAARRQAIAIAEELRRLDLGELRDALADVDVPEQDASSPWRRRLVALAGLASIGAVAYRQLSDDDEVADPFGPA
ncbi:MAG: hypothetical protein JJT89_12045 [Nitriliruptoraceae bacterium]|nr:hypothetical protein [Nitriliruptoraceae bacterium]